MISHPNVAVLSSVFVTAALLVVQSANAECLADDTLDAAFTEFLNVDAIPTAGSCCQADVCGIACPATLSPPKIGTVLVKENQRPHRVLFSFDRVRHRGRLFDCLVVYDWSFDVFLCQGGSRQLLCGWKIFTFVDCRGHTQCSSRRFQHLVGKCRSLLSIPCTFIFLTAISFLSLLWEGSMIMVVDMCELLPS
jgi:hypothetical protein